MKWAKDLVDGSFQGYQFCFFQGANVWSDPVDEGKFDGFVAVDDVDYFYVNVDDCVGLEVFGVGVEAVWAFVEQD